MQAIEIIVIIASVLIVTAVIARYIYKRVKGIPTGECETCSNKKKTEKMFANIRKELDEELKCGCNCHN
ncbi:MAG: hypothetical protein IKP77_04185 [Acholeplasmatales bacterium]|nr:hypothetical protein [Acholeplasmatales bacterium]